MLKFNAPVTMPPASSPSGLAGFNLDDLSQQAQKRLADCQAEVVRLLDAARVEAQALRDNAIADGLAEGRKRAADEAQAALQIALQARMGEHSVAARSMVDQIATQHQRWMQSYADTVIQLAIDVAERVIRARLTHEPEILIRWAADALTATRSAKRITVAVHPETLAELGKDLDELLATPGLPEDSTIVPDASVARAGVVVRQLGGEVDVSLHTQLDVLQRLLAETH